MPYKDPEKQRAFQREYQRQKRAGKVKQSSVKPCTQADRLTAARILDVLDEQIEIVRNVDQDALMKARCIGYLAAVTLRIIETYELEERVSKLEAINNEQNRTEN